MYPPETWCCLTITQPHHNLKWTGKRNKKCREKKWMKKRRRRNSRQQTRSFWTKNKLSRMNIFCVYVCVTWNSSNKMIICLMLFFFFFLSFSDFRIFHCSWASHPLQLKFYTYIYRIYFGTKILWFGLSLMILLFRLSCKWLTYNAEECQSL